MLLLNKNRYQTCLELIEQLRRESPEFVNEKLSYNGILDPMAEGIVPILVGEHENKHRDMYTGSRKEYEVTVLFGISTDSGDLLGKVIETNFNTNFDEKVLIHAVMEHPSTFLQTVPMHSNRKVRGKRLWWWMLHGVEILETERPKNQVTLYERAKVSSQRLTLSHLHTDLDTMRTLFQDRFRMPSVWESWQAVLTHPVPDALPLVIFRLLVSSGFYVRTFISDISHTLQFPIMVYRLHRKGVYFEYETDVVTT